VSSDDDSGYVHRPDDGTVAGGTAGGDGPAAAAEGSEPGAPEPGGFGSRGWVLVGVLVVCTLVIPGVIYVRPGVLSAVGIPYIASLLVLPLLPAVVLGLTAVWAMSAATRDGG